MRLINTLGIILLLIASLTATAENNTLDWSKDLEQTLKSAKADGKMVFMDIYADWCPPCKMLESDTFTDSAVIKALQDYVLIKVDADVQGEVAAQYGTGSLPTLVVLSSEGMPLLTQPGFQTPQQLLAWMGTANDKLAQFKALEAAVAANPKDVDKVFELGTEYALARQSDRALPLLVGIKEKVSERDADLQARFAYLLGVVYLSTEHFDQSTATFAALLKDFPDDFRAEHAERLMYEGQLMGAMADIESEHYEKARNSFKELTEQKGHADVAAEAERRLRQLDVLGQQAPALVVEEWLGSQDVTLADLKGKVVLIDFFQIICPGCNDAKPKIAAMQEKYGDQGLETIGLAVAFELHDSQKPDRVKSHLAENPYSYPVAIDKDQEKTFEAYRAMGTPWTILIDREGTVRYASFFREGTVEEKIQQLLAEKAEI